ncbi:MAG: hypothetical protein FWH37_04385 [Candidatus Bathyarchaeota archaeon]|nr:hypothetical protein [Candidatus Termiticorpusculum sp.]
MIIDLYKNSTTKILLIIMGNRHHRRGLLEDVPHVKLARSVIIVREVDLEKVENFLAEYGAEVCVREVVLTFDDERILNKEN